MGVPNSGKPAYKILARSPMLLVITIRAITSTFTTATTIATTTTKTTTSITKSKFYAPQINIY